MGKRSKAPNHPTGASARDHGRAGAARVSLLRCAGTEARRQRELKSGTAVREREELDPAWTLQPQAGLSLLGGCGPLGSDLRLQPPRVVGASPSHWWECRGVGRLPTHPTAPWPVSPLPVDIRCQRRAAGHDHLVRALPSFCKPRVTGLKSQ